jgi:hypothetical protein
MPYRVIDTKRNEVLLFTQRSLLSSNIPGYNHGPTAKNIFVVKIWRCIALYGITLYTGDNYWWETHLKDLWVLIEVFLDVKAKRRISPFQV